MATNFITDARAWRASTVDDRGGWYHPLSRRCLAALDRAVEKLRQQPRPTIEIRSSDYLEADCWEDLKPVLDVLERGRGFAIVGGIPVERYSPAEMQIVYWLVGQLLGRPFAQNVQGTLLYDVLDEGKDVRYGARFSVTRSETGFHTDNSFGEAVLDYVGLLCLSTAKSGGASQVVSGCTLYNELLARHPDVLASLCGPFHFDRRGGLRPGESPTGSFPVLVQDEQGLICRYLRYWIEAGHEKVGQPLTAEQKRALDVLDGVLGEKDLRVEFSLQPGEMFFINNRWLFHNRTAFEDHSEGEKRHYVRLWLQRNVPGGL
jgi:hypothetical protein